MVADDQVDAKTIQRAFRDIQATYPPQSVANGVEALQFLRDEKNLKPRLIILDLNLPGMNGIDFLRIANDDDALKTIPVIILTSSDEMRHRLDSFQPNVAGYLTKPTRYSDLLATIKIITAYWGLSELPA